MAFSIKKQANLNLKKNTTFKIPRTPFLPSSLGGLFLWLKADGGVNITEQSTLMSNLLAYWKCDNDGGLSDIPADLGNYTFNASEYGYASSSGIINNSFYFEEGSKGLFTNEQILNQTTNPQNFSCSFWIKIPDGNTPFVILGSAFGSLGFYFENIAPDDPYERLAGIMFAIATGNENDGNSFQTIQQNSTLNSDTWYHVAGTYDLGNQTMKLYINGSLVGTLTGVISSGNEHPDWHGFALNGSVLSYGKEYGGTQSLDEVGIWNKTLTATEVGLLYNAGAGRTYPFGDKVTSWADQSGNNNNMIADSGSEPTFISSELNGKPVIDFAGSRYLTASFSSTNFTQQTVFIVFKFVSANLTTYARPFSQSNIDYNDYQTPRNLLPLLRKDGTDDMWCYSPQDDTFLASLPTSNNTWYISTTKTNGSNGSFLLNGSNEQSFSAEFNADITNMRVGGAIFEGGSFNDPFNSKIAEVIVYNRDLTTQERQQVETYLNQKYQIY